ncbi:MAG: hypothetical protein LBJ23_02135 [Tannerella sp.]|jgi:hypothetical protein|nr:hypothetical protein [Tannerella sp.]
MLVENCAAFAMPAAVSRHVTFRRGGGVSVATGNEAIGTVNRIYTKEEIDRKVASCNRTTGKTGRKTAAFDHVIYCNSQVELRLDSKTAEFYHRYRIANRENTDEVIEGLELIMV